MVGDGREYNTVLIYPNKENPDFNFSEMNENQIREIFSAMLISVNGFLSSFERIVNFSVINRDFSSEKNELTQKGTFKRNNILKNFSNTIELMYKKDHASLFYKDKEIKIPNWLIREIGTIKSNIKWDGKKIIIQDKNLSLMFDWNNNELNIGNFYYKIESQIFDFSSFINYPKLWLGNQKLIEFCSSTIFRTKESIIYPEINIEIKKTTFEQNNEASSDHSDSDFQLENLHNAVTLYLSNDISSSVFIDKIISQKNNEWSDVIIDTFMQYLNHPNPLMRLKLLETISPIVSEKFFVNQLRSNFRYLKKLASEEKFIFDVTRLSNTQYLAIIDLLKSMHINIDEIDETDMSFIQEVLSIICEYGKIHPTKFISVRSELIWWQLSHSSKIQSAAQKEYYNLINGFRQWIGPNTSLTIDRETKKNIHGRMLLSLMKMYEINIEHCY